MKLLIVSSGDFYSDYGGGQIYVKTIVDSVIDSGVDVTILSLSEKDDLVNSYRNCPVYCVDTNSPEVHIKITALLELIKPDIVHAHGLKAIVSRVCHEKEIPCMITIHHAGIFCPAGALMNQHDSICKIQSGLEVCMPCVLNNIRYGKYAYLLLKNIDKQKLVKLGVVINKIKFIPYITPVCESAVEIENIIHEWHDICMYSKLLIAPSKAIARSMELNGAESNKISVLPHGITRDMENTVNNEIKKDNYFRLFFVGRINYIKGLHVLLQAFSDISPDKPIQLHIIGTAETKNEYRYMKRLQNKYKDDKRVVWHGKISNNDIGRAISLYDVMVHPAICLEVYGLNIAEALMNRKPVIATRCGGPEDQIINEVNGILVEPNSPKVLRDAIIRLYENPGLLKEMILNAKKNVVFIESHVTELIKIYNRLATS